MSLPVLYSFRRCPYAMRARLALLVSGTVVEIREVALRNKPAAMIAASPKATVPVLMTSEGRVIDESIDIMRWALRQNDPESWLIGDDSALIARFDGRFKHHLDRFKYPDRHQSEPLGHRAECLTMLAELEQRLATHTELCDERRTLPDMAIMPFVRQFAAVDPSWFRAQAVPHVQGWLERHVGSALFDQAMVRLRPWKPGDAPIMLTSSAPPLLPP